MKKEMKKKSKKEETLEVIRGYPHGISNEDIGKIIGCTRAVTSTYTRELYQEGLIDRPRMSANIIASPYMGPRGKDRRLSTDEVYDAIREHPDGITNFEMVKFFEVEKNDQWVNKVGYLVRCLGDKVTSTDIVAPSRTLKNSTRPTRLHKVNKEMM